VVHLTALPEPRFPADPKVLSRVVAAAFNQRRKMLRAALKGQAARISRTACAAAGIAPTATAPRIVPLGTARTGSDRACWVWVSTATPARAATTIWMRYSRFFETGMW
jgi:hypothetical protein